MSEEMVEMWNDMKEHSQYKRNQNRCKSTQILTDRGVKFESRNMGNHLIVETPTGIIDFWPSTGKWIRRKGGMGRGVFTMIRNMSQTDKL